MLYEIIQDFRTGAQYLDHVGAKRSKFECQMASCTFKDFLLKLYPGAKDMTGESPKGKE